MIQWHLGIKATHEEKQETALGPWQGDDVLGVALPCRKALNRSVAVRFHGKIIYCTVLDLGPWAIDDDAYVLGNARPRAEILEGKACPRTVDGGFATVPDGEGGFKPALISNGAGIDLYPGTAKALGIPLGKNVQVDWYFDDIEMTGNVL